MDSLAALAAEPTQEPEVKPNGQSWVVGATVGGGIAGCLLWKEHPILGMLDGFAVGGNFSRVVLRQIPVRRAAENLGAHLVATTGALALPSYPALGYLSGVVASNLFLRRDDTLIQRIDETVIGESRGGAGERAVPVTALLPAQP
jgi:hypothetical protein